MHDALVGTGTHQYFNPALRYARVKSNLLPTFIAAVTSR